MLWKVWTSISSFFTCLLIAVIQNVLHLPHAWIVLKTVGLNETQRLSMESDITHFYTVLFSSCYCSLFIIIRKRKRSRSASFIGMVVILVCVTEVKLNKHGLLVYHQLVCVCVCGFRGNICLYDYIIIISNDLSCVSIGLKHMYTHRHTHTQGIMLCVQSTHLECQRLFSG